MTSERSKSKPTILRRDEGKTSGRCSVSAATSAIHGHGLPRCRAIRRVGGRCRLRLPKFTDVLVQPEQHDAAIARCSSSVGDIRSRHVLRRRPRSGASVRCVQLPGVGTRKLPLQPETPRLYQRLPHVTDASA